MVCRYCKFSFIPIALTSNAFTSVTSTSSLNIPPSPPPEPDGTAVIVSEWLGAIDRARELAITQQSYNGSYSGDSTFNDLSSQISSPTGSTLGGADFGGDGALDGVNIPSAVRLRKDEDTESLRKGRKRFSRRQSKGGLAAVF